MAFGGGSFITTNKVLPGTYINFISKATAKSQLSERGAVGMGLELDWGPETGIFTVTQEEFHKDSLKLFGYESTSKELKGLRDLFLNARVLYAYRLNGKGKQASCYDETERIATATYSGVRGNDLKIVISNTTEEETKLVVRTYLEHLLVDEQIVTNAQELKDNDYVVFNPLANLRETAGLVFTGGDNGSITGDRHQGFLNAIESYPDVNVIAYVGTDETTKTLYTAFGERMRNEVGIKFQTVLYNKPADSMAVVNVKNGVMDAGFSEAALVYWAAGVIAATPINASATNKQYDGEFQLNVEFTQSQLEDAIQQGEWILHKVGEEIHVLEDINSLVTVTDEVGEVFKDNQTIRVIDQIAEATANIFNTKYLGKIVNNADGRLSLWADLKKIHEELLRVGAIENFDESLLTVSQVDKKTIAITDHSFEVAGSFTRLYMTVLVQ